MIIYVGATLIFHMAKIDFVQKFVESMFMASSYTV